MQPLTYAELDHRALSSALKEHGSVSILLDGRHSDALQKLIGVTSKLHAEKGSGPQVRRLAGASIWTVLKALTFHSKLMQVFGFYETDKPSLTIEPRSDDQRLFTFTKAA